MSGDSAPAAVTPSSETSAVTGRATRGRKRWIEVAAVVVVAAAAGFAAWLFLVRDDSGPTAAPVATSPLTATAPTSTTLAAPEIVGADRLEAESSASTIPIYWVGGRDRTKLELTQAPGGTSFVRYLPPTARAGDTREFLTIATYPRATAFAEVTTAAKDKGTKKLRLAGGGLAIYNADHPTNVHIAFPGQPYQIEVFSPTAGEAEALVSSGAVRPVG